MEDMNENRRPTINDVAKLAGVSITTVSRVINANYPVSQKTKKKVNTAIAELGFRPNLLARSLIRDRTQTIGILTPSIENLFFSEVIKGIDRYLKPKDYRTFLCDTEGKPEAERDMVDSLLNRSVDGFIIIDPRTENMQNGYFEGLTRRLPVVIINGHHEDVACHFVLNDDVTGTREALIHLKKRGLKRIGFMRGKSSHSYDIKEAIYREFCEREGYETPYIVSIDEGNAIETVALAKEGMQRYIETGDKEGHERMDGILCCNDFMGVGVIHAARAQGLVVPSDLSVIGFDNTLVSQIADPPLTTVDHHMTELGTTAAQTIVELIGDGGKGRQEEPLRKTYIATRLIIRES